MAKLIPLPRYEELPEVCLFHRSRPDSQRMLLQVPTGPETAETYVLDLSQRTPSAAEYDPRTDHKGWVERLPNSRALMDKLSYERHVAYYPKRGGIVMELDDPDNISWVQFAMMLARRFMTDSSSIEGFFARRQLQSRMPLRASALRQSLQLRPGGATW